ncbi:uncharacterized protein PHACADRAFT_94763 [Phanerochaete carnosa HHB-10118-sp]|uniref:HNH nuclease domain-containing protein n=1 Tax=Phanerochaete carnosa (strain HHB-10118-sp) TaxID=650164 RepID=K5W717_PHACS|nr:uncharacterized protein PHACADRAFT_94763 [Phanerochaete carnosa HHB-10118-sp]EKM54945.1 hypothetical protein PHACADRAFT_94763 [Phanerochaete carnosa HHB-10118-sp]
MIALHDFRKTLGDVAVSQVSKAVRSDSSRDSSAVIYELGEYYRYKLLRAFRQAKGPMPAPSQHPSRPSFATLEDMLKDALDGSGKDYRSAKKRALVRDGFRCMLSGMYDLNTVECNPAVYPEHADPVVGIRYTNCCHILSESTLQDADPDNPDRDRKREYAASVLAVLQSFGLESLVNEVVKKGCVYHLTNILTMTSYLHALFDNLHLWLEATNTSNEYKICLSRRGLVMPSELKGQTVRFEAHVPDRDDLPLPDPRLLAIHAACARVNHMSGVAEYADKSDRDAEDMRVLAEDGSSSAVLLEQVRKIAISAS